MNNLLCQSATGTPGEFAEKLGISRTRLYEIIDELRSYGAPIVYCKRLKSFYYEEPFNIHVDLDISSLDTEEKKSVHGGSANGLLCFFPGQMAPIFTTCNVTGC